MWDGLQPESLDFIWVLRQEAGEWDISYELTEAREIGEGTAGLQTS